MATDQTDKEFIYQHWKHAHEQDQGNHLVFRPATNDFPPSRGRVEFILREKDVCNFVDIASGDGQQEIKCKLVWENGTGSISIDYPNGRHRTFKIICVQADRLVLDEIY